MSWLMRSCRWLLEAVWPEQCQNCGAESVDEIASVPGLRPWDRSHLCGACLRRLCSEPVLSRLPDETPLYGGRVTGEDLVRLVGALKYHGVRGLAGPLGTLLAAGLVPQATGMQIEYLIPIPLHRRRRAERGFNQAELLSGVAAGLLGIPVLTGAVVRLRDTGQQAKLAKEGRSRAENVRGAFRAVHDGNGARVVLVDDIVTTGSTVQAAATVLRGAGWDVVGAAAVAVGAPSS